ncbi:MAG: hypothetical protein WCR45_04400 [Bacteroidaceae bacterium]|nr:hypothetical protein [Bacteroidaceae bacterium]
MGGFLNFLILAGIIIIAIAKSGKKDSSKNVTTLPGKGIDEPLGLPKGRSFGIPDNQRYNKREDEQQEAELAKEEEKEEQELKRRQESPRTIPKRFLTEESLPPAPILNEANIRPMATSQIIDVTKRKTSMNLRQKNPAQSFTDQSMASDDDYQIHNVAEARRAFVWGEIFRRKY